MSWNIAPECVSTVVLCIIWNYSRKGNPLPSMKNRMFQACFLMTFLAMTSNIISTGILYYLTPGLVFPAWLVNMVYFLTTPMLGMVYYLYVIFNIYEDRRVLPGVVFATLLPGISYVALVLLNPFMRSIFNISYTEGYTQGKYIMTTYAVFYLYCVFSVIVVIWKGRAVSSTIRHILIAFPVIAAAVIIFQMFLPNIILSGTAATSSLLIIYLYLQNKQISIDYLTEIPNRKEFLKMIELKVKRNAHKRFTIIILSLKEFKLVNDKYGQLNGDKFLVAVSDYLKNSFGIREGQLYRYSGDEFAILMEDTGKERIEYIVDTISERMQQPWLAGECSCLLSGALGVVSYPDNAAQMQELITGIEYAVAYAKSRASQEHICYCDPSVLEKANRRSQMVSILKDKLVNDEFELYYQPILSVDDGGFYIAEALLRINQSPLGAISPAEFIPVAEESGLIIDITYLVLDKVCKTIRRLRDEGLPIKGVSVNFSYLQFTQKDLIYRMQEIIRNNGIPASRIKIEITESTLGENIDVIRAFADRMHEMGIKIGLDDFGTGYSNLSSVTSFPIDTIKLDKSLIWSAVENEHSAIIVKNLSRAFRQLGMNILAEGVENQEHRTFVLDCGCSMIQGFLYAKPMPEEDFEAFLKEHK